MPGIACSVALAARKNRSNILPRSSSEMPIPESSTTSSAIPSDSARRTEIRPPSGVNFTALASRLATTCPSRWVSAVTSTVASGICMSIS